MYSYTPFKPTAWWHWKWATLVRLCADSMEMAKLVEFHFISKMGGGVPKCFFLLRLVLRLIMIIISMQ